ncbi:hypothetical protein GKZ89_09945 [Bacillus mangrovi]|uniref:Permease n=1 Tax=Metabacillus mangrovi TaxID=1491830 RepID=A0A7X2S5P8_9BACI|nr:hypothetical protein [Metabacillus mangrovi]MTH53725.1 hypothetical protein [Metabacillus mangrovi]
MGSVLKGAASVLLFFVFLFGISSMFLADHSEGVSFGAAIVLGAGGLFFMIWSKRTVYLWGVTLLAASGTLIFSVIAYRCFRDNQMAMGIGFLCVDAGMILLAFFTLFACLRGKSPRKA